MLVARRVFHYRDDMDLDALTLFHLVVTSGGFGRAARASGRAKATLSRRVAELEASLGHRLLERGGGSLRLTDVGRALIADTQDALADLAAAETRLHGREVGLRGKLRVSVPLLFGADAMGELAARFLARQPEVRLEVVAQDRHVDLDPGRLRSSRSGPIPGPTTNWSGAASSATSCCWLRRQRWSGLAPEPATTLSR